MIYKKIIEKFYLFTIYIHNKKYNEVQVLLQ